MTVDLLYDLATNLIDAADTVLSSAGLAPPTRRFVDVGTAATAPISTKGGGPGDCVDQIACVVIGPKNAQPPITTSPQSPTARGIAAVVWSATLNVSVVRCHKPASTPMPSPKILDEAAHAWLREGWQIARGFAYLWKTKALFPALGPEAAYDSIRLGDLAPIGPTGGVRGWVLPVTLLVSDLYDPDTNPG